MTATAAGYTPGRDRLRMTYILAGPLGSASERAAEFERAIAQIERDAIARYVAELTDDALCHMANGIVR